MGKRSANKHRGDFGVSSQDAAVVEETSERLVMPSDSIPKARCTHCQTIFEISPEFLTSSDTRARCGECMSIFDVLSNLRYDDFQDDDNPHSEDAQIVHDSTDNDADRAISEADEMLASSDEFFSASDSAATPHTDSDDDDDYIVSANETQVLDATYSDFDLFSADAHLPEVAYFDQTQSPELLRFNEPDGDETFSDTLFSDDMTIESPVSPKEENDTLAITPEIFDTNEDFITDEIPSNPPAFVYRDPPMSDSSAKPITKENTVPGPLQATSSDSSSGGRWSLKLVLGALMFLIAGGLYAHKERDAIFQSSVIRPHLVKLCDLAGCVVPAYVDLDALKVLKRSVFSHPTVRNALVIDLAFTNEADFGQPHPLLEIRLTDRNGGLVVKNSVEPSEYLDQWQEGDTLDSGERLDVSLTVEDPGQTATSFELQFR